ncbi:hypothetical protein CU097_001687 [Rhizopus azygosporus]|uniref:C2H2-type domain-containing protein n=2 Tax=Rhizopus TaxID=4842 RepID=A0A367IZ17_RHIAZ|nr:hypothetical protein CU097_001687 [Rhizopus azygosporus]
MNNQLLTNYDQHSTSLMSEKLPGIDKLPKLDEAATPSPPSTSSFIDTNTDTKDQNILPYSNNFLPPPSNAGYTFNNMQNSHPLYHQNMSPPLTPAVSPSSVLIDSMQFKRKFSVDVGPFGFGTNISHPSSMHDQDAFRRSSCSAMSMDDSNGYSAAVAAAVVVNSRCPPSDFLMSSNSNAVQQSAFDDRSADTMQSTTANDATPAKRRGSRAHLNGPTTQHKHGCKYPFCTWSFKRYEHLKRHMLIHTGKRPHVCHFPGCGKSFSRSDNFHAHYRTHTKKLQQQQQQQQKNSVKKSSVSSDASTAAAAAVAATAAAVVASVGTPNPSITSAPQVFDDRTQANYFAKQPFDMGYPDIYGHHHHHHHHHRPSYSAEVSSLHTYIFLSHSHMPQDNATYNQTLRNFNQPAFGLHSSHVPSLLNHEVHNQPFFASDEHDRNNQFGYHMGSMVTSPNAPTVNNGNGYRDPYGYPSYSVGPVTNNVPATTMSSSPVASNMRTTGASTSRRASSSSNQQKTHVCPVNQCQRSFKRLEHLKRHMRIHTLERPFACTFPNCHKTFSRSDNLSQHMKTHQKTEDRRRRQQPSHDFMNKQQQNNTQSTNDSTMLNNMVGISWHSANAGTVGC